MFGLDSALLRSSPVLGDASDEDLEFRGAARASSRVKSEGATDITPSIETVARRDGASSLALAGYLSFGLSANLALREQ